jgi:hypothetical protein
MVNLSAKEDYIVGMRNGFEQGWVLNELNRNKKLRERIV